MIRSPAGFDGEIRIKRYLDYYQASYGVMMRSSGQLNTETAAAYLLGSEPSGYATDFTAGGVQGNALVRTSPRNTQMEYGGTPFLAQGGPITFSRGSLATVTDIDGYIKWAPHNLLLASEQLDTSSWTKTSATIAANSIAAPDSAITADTIAASGANGTVLQSYTAVAVPYVFGVWLRRKTGTGNIQIAADNGTYTTVTITNDWALYTVTQTPTAGTKSAGIRIVTSGDEVYAWGAHLYRADLGGMQANASAYPYYSPSTPKNLLGFSEDFSNAYWTASNATVAANVAAAPNGSLSADRLTFSAQFGQVFKTGVVTTTGSVCTISVWIKRESGNANLALRASNSGTVYLQNITVTDEWARYSATFTHNGTNNIGFVIEDRNASGFGSILIWGAQLSDSASLDPYVGSYGAAPSAAAAYGPRLDYDPSTLAAKGLLVEEQRTNLLLQSNNFNTTWSKGNVNVTSDTTIGPDGALTADTITSTAGFGSVSQSIVAVIGTTYCGYIIIKKTVGALAYYPLMQFNIGGAFTGVIINTTTGGMNAAVGGSYTAPVSFGSLDYGQYWLIYATFVAAGTNVLAEIYPAASSNGSTLTGAVTGSQVVWSAQLEAGTFATSYIPTAAASVTRNADVASVGVSQFPYSATEGSIVANVTPLNVAAARRAVQIDDNTENERYTLSTNSTPNGLFTVIDGGSSQAAIATGTPAANTNIKLAARYKVNDFALSVNGGAASTDTSGTLPIANLLMRLGSGTSSTEPLNGHIRQITYIPRALTNAELTARSA